MEYNFSGSLTVKDYIQCCRFLNRKRKVYVIILSCLVLLIFIFLSYNFMELKEYLSENPLHIFRILYHKYFIKYYLIATLTNIIIYFLFDPLYYKRHYKSDKLIKAERHFCITDEYISVQTEDLSSKITKDKIRKIVFTKDTIYIFTSMTHILTIKKRYLGDDSAFNELKVLINEKYNVKKANGITSRCN